MNEMNALINRLSDETFKYGSADCFTFTNALVKEWHGRDYRLLHPYKTKYEAKKYLALHGGIISLAVGTLGYSVDPIKCVDGDVVAAQVAPGEVALGFVFRGNGLFKGKKCVLKLSLTKCLRGWNI